MASEFRTVSNKQMADTIKRAIQENVTMNSQLSKNSFTKALLNKASYFYWMNSRRSISSLL